MGRKRKSSISSIQKEREELGWSRQRLASALGVHRTTVYRWELGVTRVPEPASRLARVVFESGGGDDDDNAVAP